MARLKRAQVGRNIQYVYVRYLYIFRVYRIMKMVQRDGTIQMVQHKIDASNIYYKIIILPARRMLYSTYVTYFRFDRVFMGRKRRVSATD